MLGRRARRESARGVPRERGRAPPLESSTGDREAVVAREHDCAAATAYGGAMAATKVGKPKAEKPKAEKPKAEKPKAEKPKAEKPKAGKPKAPRSEFTTARLELSLECMRCQHPMALSRVGESQRCGSCLRAWTLAAASWASLRAGFAAALRGAGARFGAELEGPHRVGASLEVAPARCACGAEHSANALVAALSEGRASIACACGRSMGVRAPDAALLAMAPSARAVANEREDAWEAPAPVAFRCGCGASLRADGRSRAVPCQTCGPVDVPPPLWRVLRPVLPRTPMFVVIERGA